MLSKNNERKIAQVRKDLEVFDKFHPRPLEKLHNLQRRVLALKIELLEMDIDPDWYLDDKTHRS